MTADFPQHSVLGQKVEINALALAALIADAEENRSDDSLDVDLQSGWGALAEGAPEIAAKLHTHLRETLSAEKFDAIVERVEGRAMTGSVDAEIGSAIAQAALRLIQQTPGASSLDEIAALRGTPREVLIAEESGVDIEVVRAWLGDGPL